MLHRRHRYNAVADGTRPNHKSPHGSVKRLKRYVSLFDCDGKANIGRRRPETHEVVAGLISDLPDHEGLSARSDGWSIKRCLHCKRAGEHGEHLIADLDLFGF